MGEDLLQSKVEVLEARLLRMEARLEILEGKAKAREIEREMDRQKLHQHVVCVGPPLTEW